MDRTFGENGPQAYPLGVMIKKPVFTSYFQAHSRVLSLRVDNPGNPEHVGDDGSVWRYLQTVHFRSCTEHQYVRVA